MDLNKAIIVGRVTAVPTLRSTPGGQSVASVGVATNRVWTDKNNQKQEEVEFHNVVFWGRQAEIAAQYLVKGAMVLIEGRIHTRDWTDKQGGKRKTTDIICERLQLGPKPQGAGGDAAPRAATKRSPAQPEGAPPLDEIPVINLEEDEIRPEDIPF